MTKENKPKKVKVAKKITPLATPTPTPPPITILVAEAAIPAKRSHKKKVVVEAGSTPEQAAKTRKKDLTVARPIPKKEEVLILDTPVEVVPHVHTRTCQHPTSTSYHHTKKSIFTRPISELDNNTQAIVGLIIGAAIAIFLIAIL